jgi:hypothetical protein
LPVQSGGAFLARRAMMDSEELPCDRQHDAGEKTQQHDQRAQVKDKGIELLIAHRGVAFLPVIASLDRQGTGDALRKLDRADDRSES